MVQFGALTEDGEIVVQRNPERIGGACGMKESIRLGYNPEENSTIDWNAGSYRYCVILLCEDNV